MKKGYISLAVVGIAATVTVYSLSSQSSSIQSEHLKLFSADVMTAADVQYL
jgi:type II secretory pathway pseudopilin PulG